MFLHIGQSGHHLHFSTFEVIMAWRIAAPWVCGCIFIWGLEVDLGGIGQSFLNSNRFPDIDLAPGYGVEYLQVKGGVA